MRSKTGSASGFCSSKNLSSVERLCEIWSRSSVDIKNRTHPLPRSARAVSGPAQSRIGRACRDARRPPHPPDCLPGPGGSKRCRRSSSCGRGGRFSGGRTWTGAKSTDPTKPRRDRLFSCFKALQNCDDRVNTWPHIARLGCPCGAAHRGTPKGKRPGSPCPRSAGHSQSSVFHATLVQQTSALRLRAA